MAKYLSLLLFGLLNIHLSFSQNIGIGTPTPAFKLDVKNGSINTDSVYRISTFTALSIAGNGNLFVGRQAGLVNTGVFNTFSGHTAGVSNTTGSYNSFFGSQAGWLNTTGSFNSFFGMNAGALNTTGFDNSFFGRESGGSNSSGSGNNFFGRNAGLHNTTGYSNIAIGKDALYSNIVNHNNVAIGDSALFNQNGNVIQVPTDPINTAVGSKAGFANLIGTGNSYIGF